MSEVGSVNPLTLKPSRPELLRLLTLAAYKELDKRKSDLIQQRMVGPDAAIERVTKEIEAWWAAAVGKVVDPIWKRLVALDKVMAREVKKAAGRNATLSKTCLRKPTVYRDRSERWHQPTRMMFDFGPVKIERTFTAAPRRLLAKLAVAEASRKEYVNRISYLENLKARVQEDPVCFVLSEMSELNLEDIQKRATEAISRMIKGNVNG